MALIVVVAACFGLPLNGWPSFLALSFAAVASLVGRIRTDKRGWTIACAIGAACIVLRAALPVHHIDEGHSVFSSDGGGPLASALPADVFAATRRLQESLPKRFDQKPAPRAWAISADGIWNPSPLSRSRPDLDFVDRWWFRVGTLNDNLYNDRRPGLYLPLVFRFDLPETTKGGRLCWTGTLFWPRDDGSYVEHRTVEQACREIQGQFAPRAGDGRSVFTLYAADFNRDRPLAIQLDRTGFRDYTPTVIALAGIAGAIAVLALLVRLRAAAVGAWSLAVLSIPAYMWQRLSRGEPPPFSGFIFMGRGNDGLTYYGHGRTILTHLVEGNWLGAARGDSDVFYYSPGMQYIWTGLTSIFGDSFFGYLLIIVVIPFVVLHLVRVYAGPTSAILLFWCFLLVPVFESLGFLYWYYVKLAVRGFGGGIAWCALFSGVFLLARRLDTPKVHRGGLLAAGLLLAVAIFCRPNLAVGAVVLVAGTVALLLCDRRFALPARVRDAAMLCAGVAAIFAVTLHNWYFGEVFVPLTRSWSVGANLQLLPSAYANALNAMLAGDPTWIDQVLRIQKHLRIWMNFYEFWRIIPYVTLWVALFRRELTPFIRILALSLLADHAVFLFYPGDPRYLYGIWLLTFVVFIAAVRRVYWPAAKRRWPALAAVREPGWLRGVVRFDPVIADTETRHPRDEAAGGRSDPLR